MYLELLNSILRQDDSWGIQSRVNIDHAIQGVVVRLRARSIDADGISFSLSHLTLLADGLNGARADKQQAQEVAPVERKLIDLSLADELSHR